MVPGFLLDNNHIDAYYRKSDPAVVAKLAEFPDAIILTSVFALGEVEAGHLMPHKQTPPGQVRRDEFVAWLNKTLVPNAKEVTVTTAHHYAKLIGRIWNLHKPVSQKTGTEKHLLYGANQKNAVEYCVRHGVDINDVWAVAVAWEHGLTFLTTDAMTWVREAAGEDVKWDCWITKPTSSPTA